MLCCARMQGRFLSIRGILVTAGVLSVLLLAVGCGSDDGEATGSSENGEVTVETGSLSKAEFVKQASAACAKTREQLTQEFVKLFEQASKSPPKPTEVSPEVKFVEENYVTGFQRQIDEVSALGAPAGDEEEITAFLESMQQEIEKAAEDPQAFITRDAGLGKAPKLAKAYGLTNCAEL